ncbi:unnamed protein product [Ilex paraguariensis]|uniref:Acid phosphatase n=1 Tax=Ilex paraguariensis TaxID=185542 RepID=A0ABC8U697_9AQUA
MAEIALEYAESVELVGDGKDVWVFDIDETSLSDLPYYARSDVGFGAIAFNDTKFDEWLAEGIAPAIPAVHKFYEKLLSLGFKIVFLSGSAERIKDIRISNLKGSGYHTWEKLILKKDSEKGTTALVYKSNKRKELEEAGYRIWGNMGDQWSDLLGNNVGNRTFKVPNPMFYIG